MTIHEPPGTRLTLPASHTAAFDHLAELREAAEHARLASVARAIRTDAPAGSSTMWRDLLAAAVAVLRAARLSTARLSTARLSTARRATGRPVRVPVPRERLDRGQDEACATC